MIRKLLLTSAIAFGSTFTAIHPVSAQTTDPYTNELLRQTNSVITDTMNWINNVGAPAAQRRQDYLQQLLTACTTYNDMDACNTYNIEIQRQLRHMESVNQQAEQYFRNW